MNDKISGYFLDREQKAIVLDESSHLLVVAGAGSGKTLTILGKIHYLVKYKKIKQEEILCISFTRASANSLKEKIEKEFSYTMPVYTFHKLSLEILKDANIYYEIADNYLLEDIIHEFIYVKVLENEKFMKLILNYFSKSSFSNVKNKYLCLLKEHSEEIQALERLIATFLNLFKCNNYLPDNFLIFLKKIRKTINPKRYRQEKIFLLLAINIYVEYHDYLKENKEIDFDDMIIKATNYVKENSINKDYKYIIIDEYQDTSYVRFCLIQELLRQTCSKLMVVGDDFQSIYRFTGCDLSLFLNFKKYFPDSKIMKIENTYRNSQELIKIAGDFVMKNRKQIPKELHSNKNIEKPIELIYYQNKKDAFKKIIIKIYSETKKPIMILGRNNKDINKILDNEIHIKKDNNIIYQKHPEIFMYFMTVHKSKGLEEENVILINLEDNTLGFPNKIKDNKILRLVTNTFDKYPYSEERRLFYVALTRTKTKVYILVSKKNESIFINELIKNYHSNINISKI